MLNLEPLLDQFFFRPCWLKINPYPYKKFPTHKKKSIYATKLFSKTEVPSLKKVKELVKLFYFIPKKIGG